MRRIKQVLLFAAMIIALGSCKKDSVFTLVGLWNIDSITTDVKINNLFNLPTEVQENAGEIEFREDHTGTFARLGEFTWTHSGNLLTVKLVGEDGIILPDLEFELTTMEPERVVGEMEFTIDGDDLDFLLNLIDIPDIPSEFVDFIDSIAISMVYDLSKK